MELTRYFQQRKLFFVGSLKTLKAHVIYTCEPKNIVKERNEMDLLTSKEVAELLRVRTTTMNTLRKQGLPFYMIGRSYRYLESEIKEYIENGKAVQKRWTKRDRV